MRVLRDTNILVRVTDRDHMGHREAVAALESMHAAGFTFVVVPQVLYEFWVVATRPREQNGLGMSVEEADFAVEERMAIFRLLLDERGVFLRWRELVRSHAIKGKPAHDARLVAAMYRHGLEAVLTFNAADFRRFSDIVVIVPGQPLPKMG